MKARLTLLMIFLIPCSSFCLRTARKNGSCVTCHTDEAMLKKTCKPFVIPEGEGEG